MINTDFLSAGAGILLRRSLFGDLLEKLKNRKSDLIVQAVWEYIGNHPEVMAENAKIVITVQSRQRTSRP